MKWFVAAFLIRLALSPVFAANTAVSAEKVFQQANTCFTQAQSLLAQMATLETDARTANETNRADCLKVHITSLTGLIGAVKVTRDRLESLAEDGADALAATELDLVLAACKRTAKLGADAQACLGSSVTITNIKPVATSTRKPIAPLARERPPWLTPRRNVVRNDDTCLRQEALAGLLAAAMGLVTSGDANGIAALTKLHIEPLGGWQPAACATVADLHVITALALHLEVDDPDKAADYAQALRNEGLPVDTLLPAVGNWDSPPRLLPAEARAFLANGLAAPLPTSRHYMPR